VADGQGDRPAIAASAKDWFHVVEFNVLSNHVHLIVEADDADALSRGVQGLAIRIARRVNSALKRRGKLFGQRFHARTLKSPRDVRNTLRYVLRRRSGSTRVGSIPSRARSGSAGARRFG
jgi:putative transposase